MKPLLPILLWLWPCFATAKAKEVSSVAKSDTLKAATKAAFQKPEIFTSCYSDIINKGQANTSTKFIHLFIGDLFSGIGCSGKNV